METHLPRAVYSSCSGAREGGINSLPCLSWEANYLLASHTNTHLVDRRRSQSNFKVERAALPALRLGLIHILLVFLICRGFAERAGSSTNNIYRSLCAFQKCPPPAVAAPTFSQSVCRHPLLPLGEALGGWRDERQREFIARHTEVE